MHQARGQGDVIKVQSHEGVKARARAPGIQGRSHPKCHLHIHAYNRPLHGEPTSSGGMRDTTPTSGLNIRSPPAVFVSPLFTMKTPKRTILVNSY